MWGPARAVPACVVIAAAVALAAFGAAPALAAAAGPPTGVLASPGDGQATVSFTPPSSDGGSPITQYTVTASPGGQAVSGTASPILISGLTDGISYTFTVTAVNSSGPGAPSNPSAAVRPLAPPAATFDPVISGSAEVGQTLHATSGTWSEPSDVSYRWQWLDCDPSSGNCFGVAGAPSGADYTVSALDGGFTIAVVVTVVNVDNEFGSDTSASTATVAAQPGAPVLESPPTLSAVDASEPVAATSGTWSGAPTGYSYEWYACPPGMGWCHPVSGLSSLLGSYKPVQDEAGELLKVAVVATNAAGSSVPAFSAPSGAISFPPPTTSISPVGGQPTITLTGPANGATYTQGSSLPVAVTCTAFDGSSLTCIMQQSPQPPCQARVALVGCTYSASAPGPPELDTQELGGHTFTITTADAFAESASLTVAYTVVGGPTSATAAQDARVTLTRLSQSSSRWRIGDGTRFSLTPNRAAVVTFVFQRDLKGRRAAGRCAAQTPANLHGPACTLTKRAGSLTTFEPQGRDVVPFYGRLGPSRLTPGNYSVLVSAVAIGEKSPVAFKAGTLKFAIVK